MKKIIITLLCLTTSINMAFADHWTGPTENDYEDRAPLYLQVYLSQEHIASANDYVEIAAFINNEIRGQVIVGQSQATAYSLLEVRGNISEDTGKTITFKAFYNGLEYELLKTETWNYEASAHQVPFNLYLDALTEVKLPATTQLEGVLPFTHDIGADITYVMGGVEQSSTTTTNSKLTTTLTYTWDFSNSSSFFTVDENNILTAIAEISQGYLGLTVRGGEAVTGAEAGPTTFSAYTTVNITAAEVPPTSITVNPTSIEANIGDNVSSIISYMIQNRILTVTVLPQTATDQSWEFSWTESEGMNADGTITMAGTYYVNFHCTDYPDISATMTIVVKNPITIGCPETLELYTTRTTTLTLTASGDDLDPSKISIVFDGTDGFGEAASAVPADDTGLVWNCLGKVYGYYNYYVLYDGEYLMTESQDEPVGGLATINAEIYSEAGWDWISINALPMDYESLPIINEDGSYIDEISDNIIEIRSQTQLLYNDPQNGIFGDITEFTPAAGMYKVKSQKGMSILLGPDVSSESTYSEILGSQTMKKGYNWISYTGCSKHSLESGWVEGASEGDMIIGKDNFSTYSAGTWVTSETNPFVFMPGKGYIYYAQSEKATTVDFNYLEPEFLDENGNNSGEVNKRNFTELTGLTVDASRFADNMPVIAKLTDIDNPQNFIVAAFVNDECRGYGTLSQTGEMFINVGGKAGEKVEFKIYDIQTGEEILMLEQIPFSAMAGSIKAPVMLSHEMLTGIDDINISDKESYQVYDAAGRMLPEMTKGVNIIKTKDGKAVKVIK